VLATALKPVLPKGWVIEGSSRPVANVPNTIVKLQQLAVRKLAQAPAARHEIDIRATITAPGEDTKITEDRLDDDLLTFLTALDDLHVKYGEATKVIAESRLGYDITITVLGMKE
jgi:hypothetical protein